MVIFKQYLLILFLHYLGKLLLYFPYYQNIIFVDFNNTCQDKKQISIRLIQFPVWLRNRLISGGLEPDLSYIYRIVTLCYSQFSTNIKIYNHNIKTNFNIHGKLSIIQCDK